MNKAVLLSIKPEYCSLIGCGKKTVEARKTTPKLKPPFKVYIYCTASNRYTGLVVNKAEATLFATINYKTAIPIGGYMGNGKVIGEFVCDKLIWVLSRPFNSEIPNFFREAIKSACLTEKEVETYSKGKEVYGWHISDLVIYDEPKELNDFAKANFPTFDEMNDDASLCKYCPASNFGEDFVNGVPDDFQCDVDCYDAYEEYAAQNRFLTRPPQSWCYVEEIKNETY